MTTKIVNHSKKDDAVSPVVGVMLMLVVTIVIAAVVALFATSIVTDMDAAPVAVIQMDAYAGEPAANNDLCMSIIGGKALELSKLKCVVTVEDGKYGLVFKSLDTDPVVGKFLEIGEKLEVFNLDSEDGKTGGMRKINSLVGADIKTEGALEDIFKKVKSYWEVGNKINVMIVFNEDAILYKKDIIIQDGQHGTAVVVDDTNPNVTWTKDSSAKITWDNSTVTVSDPKSTGIWTVTIAETAANGSTGSIQMTVAPSAAAVKEGKVLTGIKVTDSAGTKTLDATTTTTGNFTGSLTFAATVEEESSKITITLAPVTGGTWSPAGSVKVDSGTPIQLLPTLSGDYDLVANPESPIPLSTLTLDSGKVLTAATFTPNSEPPVEVEDILNDSFEVTKAGTVDVIIDTPTTTTNVTLNANGGTSTPGTTTEGITMTYGSSDVPTITPPTAPTGGIFGGWTATQNGTDVVINSNGNLVANVSGWTDANGKWNKTDSTATLYAKWTITLTLSPAFGSSIAGGTMIWKDGSDNPLEDSKFTLPLGCNTFLGCDRKHTDTQCVFSDGSSNVYLNITVQGASAAECAWTIYFTPVGEDEFLLTNNSSLISDGTLRLVWASS